jgi:hypothetical protein
LRLCSSGPIFRSPGASQPATNRVANPETTDAATGVKLTRVPDGGIQPQAAINSEGVLHLIYFGDDPAGGNIYYVRKSPDGEQFA